MRLLLDTHAVFWWLRDDPQLSQTARQAIGNIANEAFASACVGYEIAYKQKFGRMAPLPEPLSRRLLLEGIGTLPVSLDHALAAAQLPGLHRDPWDRIMIAQALAEQLQVVTVDRVFSHYGVPVIR